MIVLDTITKRYDGTAVVDGISLTVESGRICALVGPSGSGKSTTLRLINRLIDLDGGRISIEGEDIAALPLVALRRRIGYVIQSGGLFPHWTVGRNVATVPRLLGWPAARVRERVAELLSLVGLEPGLFRDRYPHQLSGGQQQRVGVARALAADPGLLLMDEPFGALDPITREVLQDELLRIQAATAKTVILVTHDIDEAVRLASQIAILDQGRLVQSGRPRDLLRQPANDFVRDFVGGDKLGLRLLKVIPVRDHMRREAVPEAGAPSIEADAHLDAAVALMVARKVDRLAVADGPAGLVGTLHLADVAGA